MCHLIIMLKFKKVYIDSYYKVGGTSSNFIIDLPETVQLEENMLCQIHEVSIPHSWYSINSTNNNLYFRHQVIPPGVIAGITYRKIIHTRRQLHSGGFGTNDRDCFKSFRGY